MTRSGRVKGDSAKPKRALRLAIIAFLLTIYAVFGPFGYLAFMAWSLLPTKKPLRRAKAMLAIQRRAFRGLHAVMRFTRLLDYRPELTAGLPEQPSVIVANHPSLVDTTSILGTFPNVVTVVKPSIYRRWWIRPLMAGAHFIEGSRDASELGRLIDDAVLRLEQGFHVLVFPEGTRSPEGDLHPFGRVAFEVACRAQAPVVPIVITCYPLWLSKEYPMRRPPDNAVHYQLEVLPPVTAGELGGSSRALRQRIFTEIRAKLPTLPP